MATRIKLPENYERIDTDSSLVDEGAHRCRVVKVQEKEGDGGGAAISFRVLEGACRGLHVEQHFNFRYVKGVQAFKKLMHCLGIKAADSEIDLEPAVNREVIVTVEHRESEGKTYANAVDFERAT